MDELGVSHRRDVYFVREYGVSIGHYRRKWNGMPLEILYLCKYFHQIMYNYTRVVLSLQAGCYTLTHALLVDAFNLYPLLCMLVCAFKSRMPKIGERVMQRSHWIIPFVLLLFLDFVLCLAYFRLYSISDISSLLYLVLSIFTNNFTRNTIKNTV